MLKTLDLAVRVALPFTPSCPKLDTEYGHDKTALSGRFDRRSQVFSSTTSFEVAQVCHSTLVFSSHHFLGGRAGGVRQAVYAWGGFRLGDEAAAVAAGVLYKVHFHAGGVHQHFGNVANGACAV